MKTTQLKAEKIGNQYSQKNNELIQNFLEDVVLDFDEINILLWERLIKQLTENISHCLFKIADYAYERELYEAQRRFLLVGYYIYDEDLLALYSIKEIAELVRKHVKNYKDQIEIIMEAGRINHIPRKEIETLIRAQTGTIGECGLTHKIMRILRTESNAVQAKASVKAYHDAGVDTYTYHAILDNRVCEECFDLDGLTFLVSDAERGVNLPPLHPNCRCFVTPGGQILHDISFAEWRKKYLR